VIGWREHTVAVRFPEITVCPSPTRPSASEVWPSVPKSILTSLRWRVPSSRGLIRILDGGEQLANMTTCQYLQTTRDVTAVLIGPLAAGNGHRHPLRWIFAHDIGWHWAASVSSR